MKHSYKEGQCILKRENKQKRVGEVYIQLNTYGELFLTTTNNKQELQTINRKLF